MIAGEDMIGEARKMNNAYLGFSGSKKRTAEEEDTLQTERANRREARKQSASKFAGKVRQEYDKAGGIEGLANKYNKFRSALHGESVASSVSGGDSAQQASPPPVPTPADDAPKKKGIPKEVWIIGGAVLLIAGGIFIYVKMKHKPSMPSGSVDHTDHLK